MKGTVYLVGAGPGSPDLLTLRACRLLEQADVVFYDALVNPAIVALAVRAEKTAVGKRCGQHSTAQRFINKRLVDAAASHPVVVRLKGGDPMLFGRAQEEIEALVAANVRFEVVPGVTSALAASAEIGVSLTRRGVSRSVSFVTPRIGADQPQTTWIASAIASDTTVIYMGSGEANAIATALIAAGKPAETPVLIAEDASNPGSQYIAGTLEDLPRMAEQCGGGPALILIGEVYRQVTSLERAQHERICA